MPNGQEESLSDRLTSMCVTIVVTGGNCRLGTFIVPVNGVQSNKLLPRPFCQLDPKDLF